MDKKIIFSVIIGSIAVLLGSIVLVVKTAPTNLKLTKDATIKFSSDKNYDWGEIDIDGGNKEKTFPIKNTGSADLEITDFKTSCMCTTVKVIINNQESPAFGMHNQSTWKGIIKPNQTAQIKVIFNPLYHGPQGLGPITRLISFKTNDEANSKIELRLTGNVVKKQK